MLRVELKLYFLNDQQNYVSLRTIVVFELSAMFGWLNNANNKLQYVVDAVGVVRGDQQLFQVQNSVVDRPVPFQCHHAQEWT